MRHPQNSRRQPFVVPFNPLCMVDFHQTIEHALVALIGAELFVELET